MQHTKRYLLVPEEIYQSLASPPPSDGTPIGLVRNRIKQIKNDDGINEAERAIKYEQELKRFNKLTRDEDERPVGVKLENLSDVVDAMPKSVNVRRPIVVATRRHLKVGRARKENVEHLEDDDDDHHDDHDHETPKPSSSNKRQPTQTEILKLIYKNAQSLGVSEEGQVLRAGGRPFITSSVYDIVSHLLNKDKRAQNKEPTAFKEFVERARQIPLLTTQRTYTLHRQAKRRYRRLPTLAPGLHTEWQADLAIFDRLAKQNRGYKYLLVCIDTLSRQLFVEPVKTKTSANMIIAFGRIFKRSKYIPWKVLTDQGKEFTARAVQQFFRTNDVEHFCMLTSPQFHAGMAERANLDGTLFSSYVNTFVGLKVQATGWPEGCVTDEQHQAFVDDFERAEGIRLDSTKMEFNPGLRLIAKTLANSLWGKLAQRVGQTEIRYTRTPAEFHALLDDPTLDKLDFVHVSEHMDRCVVRKRPEFARAPLTNCLPVAAFVTSYGRLHLYDYMEQVSAIDDAELLYCDTDSIYYVNKMGGPCVAEGEALGQMKREHTDRRIVEFVAGGPKNYGIRHTARDGTDERANLKIRSFRLSYTAQQLLTFEAMKDLTLATYNIDGPIDDALDNDDLYVYGGGEHRAIRVNFPQIDRNVYADLYTHEAHKDYRPFYAKGRVRPGMQTCPFGYVEDDGQPNEGQRTHRRKRNFVEQDPTQPGHSGWF
ncbi:hypothetical protein niasHT_037896 [Heterodera trifolii]|uniref:Integrase catalytic domain-containing protein n=1 Tax=Heterodera trifolii TaxID=157864 RepID=A0ABD2IPZ8_9BILA